MKLNKVLFGMILSVSTCSVLAAEPAPVIDISQRNDSSVGSRSLSEQLESLERKIDSRNKAQVNVQRQLEDLQNELNELRGVTELHTHQLSQVLERQRELYQELDRRVSQALTATPNQPPVTTPNYNASNVNDVVYSTDVPENEAYDKAVNLVLKERRYEEAIPEFQAFNLKFPNSTYSANAHYWLGQLLFNKNDLTAAKAEFEMVYNKFKESPKRSDSMLKLATVEQKLGDNAKAKRLLNELIAEYPTSSAAKLAKPRLANL